jgi:hypothetical protein
VEIPPSIHAPVLSRIDAVCFTGFNGGGMTVSKRRSRAAKNAIKLKLMLLLKIAIVMLSSKSTRKDGDAPNKNDYTGR